MSIKTTLLGKKFICLFAALVMLCAMAAPAFAAVGNPTPTAGTYYRIYPNGTTSHLLNVYGNGNANDNVTLYTPTNGNDQRWRLVLASNNPTSFYVVSALSNTQALNIYHATGNCQLYSYANNTTNNRHDSAVCISTTARTIKLRDWTEYLSFGSVATNANVSWTSTHSAWGWQQ